MNNTNQVFILVLLALISCNPVKVDFEIKDNAFMLDAKPFQLICGEMHYPRIPQEYWRDRMRRAKAMGLNTISTCVFWNYHERQPGIFDFRGQADVARFVRIAQEEGLYVILRPGPYVCADWDFGGCPAWLQKDRQMIYRSDDKAFLAACERYLKRLGEELASLTVSDGGPILMVQIENGYGAYGNDKAYLAKIRDMIKKAGFSVPLITCDAEGQLENGRIAGAWPAVNGLSGEEAVRVLDKYCPGGPYYVSEFYSGWFDVWGRPHFRSDYKSTAERLDWMLKNGMSVNLYMFHGGTNYAYTNGANTTFSYAPQPTSYDYDAPLGESGNITPKYRAYREVIRKNLPDGEVLPDIPAENPVISFPRITLDRSALLSAAFTERIVSDRPLPMEYVNQDLGYIHYETVIEEPVKGLLWLKDLRDYAVVSVNGKQVGSLDRRLQQNKLPVDIRHTPARLEILVENAGRVNYGIDIQNNLKGITEKVLLDGKELNGWTVTPLPLYKTDVSDFDWERRDVSGHPAFFKGTFTLSETGDCFVDTRGWGKGAVWVNGRSLGKFWSIGPQQTLYLPAPWLKKGDNEIVVFELENTGHRTIQGLDKPILDEAVLDKNEVTVGEKDKNVLLNDTDCIFKGTLENSDGWQRFDLEKSPVLRYICLEVVSSRDSLFSCICELNLRNVRKRSLPKDKWKVIYADTEQIGEGEADHLIDGNPNTYWHSRWQGDRKSFPHRIVVDLGENVEISGFEIKQRTPALPGCVKDFRLYGSQQPFRIE